MSETGPSSSKQGAVVFCSSCGKPVLENAKFCRSCGASQDLITVTASASSSAPAQARTRPWGVTSVALLLILFGFGNFVSLVIGEDRASIYGWASWLYYNIALVIYFMPADFVMAIGLLRGRLWGWKLTVASFSALVLLSFPPIFGLWGLRDVAAVGLWQIFVAFWISIYLARSKNVRAYFRAEGIWPRFSRFHGYKPSGGEKQ